MYQRPLSELKYIVVHHSATPEYFSVDEIRKIHLEKSYSDIGYHFLVNEKGMHPGRDVHFCGAHAIGEKGGCPPPNHYAVGLCLIGNFEYRKPSPKVINEAVYALKILSKKFGIPLDKKHILGHRDVDFTACPGKYTMPMIFEKLGI